jgi:hypothetical protein
MGKKTPARGPHIRYTEEQSSRRRAASDAAAQKHKADIQLYAGPRKKATNIVFFNDNLI